MKLTQVTQTTKIAVKWRKTKRISAASRENLSSGLRPVPTLTRLYSHFRRVCTIYVAQPKALISLAITEQPREQLTWAFVFTYVKKIRFSHDAALFKQSKITHQTFPLIRGLNVFCLCGHLLFQVLQNLVWFKIVCDPVHI